MAISEISKAKRNKIYEDVEKSFFEGPEPGTLIQYFKDQIFMGEGKEPLTVSAKGVLNNRISEMFLIRLEELGIKTYFLRRLNMREQLIRIVDLFPFRVIVRNFATGPILVNRLGFTQGMKLPRPVVEFWLFDDQNKATMMGEHHLITFEWAMEEEIEDIKSYMLRINDFLSGYFSASDFRLSDFSLEFGRIFDENTEQIFLTVASEITPETFRLWDTKSGTFFDKDYIINAPLEGEKMYQDIARRIGVLIDN